MRRQNAAGRRNQEGGGGLHRVSGAWPSSVAGRTMLLISQDTAFHENLREMANALGQMVVRVNGSVGAVAVLRATRPAAVLLDLALPAEVARETAAELLRCQHCPPLLLLAEGLGPFDYRTEIPARVLFDKGGPPSRLLKLVEEALTQAAIHHTDRGAIRAFLRRLKPGVEHDGVMGKTRTNLC